MIHETVPRYGGVAIVLHWLIALLIATNFILVWTAEDLPEAQQMQQIALHKSVGISVLILSVIRILWRIAHRPPPLQRSLQPWERVLARAVHTLFYVAMIGIPLAGWAMVSARGPVSVFGLFSMPALPVPTTKAAGDTFFGIHENLATLFLVLAGIHVLGALKHQFLDRDGTLGRMIPFLGRPRV